MDTSQLKNLASQALQNAFGSVPDPSRRFGQSIPTPEYLPGTAGMFVQPYELEEVTPEGERIDYSVMLENLKRSIPVDIASTPGYVADIYNLPSSVGEYLNLRFRGRPEEAAAVEFFPRGSQSSELAEQAVTEFYGSPAPEFPNIQTEVATRGAQIFADPFAAVGGAKYLGALGRAARDVFTPTSPEELAAMQRLGIIQQGYMGVKGSEPVTNIRTDLGELSTKGTGAWATKSRGQAYTYANQGQIVPIEIEDAGFANVNFAGENWKKAPEGAKLEIPGQEAIDVSGMDTNAIARIAREQGVPGLRFQNIWDEGPYGAMNMKVPGVEEDINQMRRGGVEQYVVFDDSRIMAMSPEARNARAQEMGMIQKAYTGSTHPNIVEFDASLANPENDWGRAIYSSTSTEDVAANYATISGPDITQRIAIRAENLFDEMDRDEVKRIAEAQLGKKWEEMSYSEKREPLKEIARKEIAGESLGVTYPLRINTQEYAVIGGKKPTYLEEPDYDSVARADIDETDFDDLDEYEDAVNERIWELREEDPNSLPIRVSDALQNSDIGADERTVQAIMEDLTDDLYSGEMKVQDLDAAIRKNALDAYDEEGNLLSPGEISSQVLKNLGFKGVVDNTVYEKFGAVSRGRQVGMAGVTEDTAHIITFPEYENTIRSEFAKFDPTKAASKEITAGVGGVGLTGLIANEYQGMESEAQPVRPEQFIKIPGQI